MRVIQAGILVCLTAIAGLLVAIYQQQADIRAAAENGSQQTPTEVPQTALLEPAPAKPVEAAVVKPVPASAPKPAQPKPRPSVRERVAPPPPKPAEQPAAAEIPTPAPDIAEAKPAEPVQAEPAPPIEPDAPLREEAPVKPREPRVVTLPSGTALTVRVDGTLSTSRNEADDTFFATLDEPLIVDGLVIADKGARLEGRVVESQQAGRVKGLAQLALELAWLHTDDGQRVEIETSTYTLDGPSSRNDDLKKIGIGAGAGAILGAIFGGGKGAAIGAASGAGAGAGTAAATRGEPAVIEPETRLDFRLAEGVTITEKL